jgi:DNA polymerase-3 subunit epsilon
VYVKNDTIVNEEHYYIKPPKGQDFKQRYIDIHGITPADVEDSENFDHYWMNGLNDYFNNNLIIFHNASMDLSILRQLFELYQISDFDIEYLDTMNLASYLGLPKKIIELAEILDIKVINHHNPVEDAKLCAHVFAELRDREFDCNKIKYKLSYQDTFVEIKQYAEILATLTDTYEDCDKIVSRYLVQPSQIRNVIIPQNAFLITGDLRIPRDEAQEIIKKLGGIVKNGISSKVNYVILGSGYGWSKIETVAKLNMEKNLDIKIINEEGFNELIKNAL